jgi:hypothetical protein
MAFPKKNKDIPAEVAFPMLGSKDPMLTRTEPVDDTYDYTNQSWPGRIGVDPRLSKAQSEHKKHKPLGSGRQE